MNRNIKAKNYFENIGTIKRLNIYYEGKEETEYLYLLILTSKKTAFGNSQTEKVPMERYTDDPQGWQMYAGETVTKILEEFRTKSTISLSVYFLDKDIPELDVLDDEIEPVTKNFVLIADAFSLQFEKIADLAKLFDSKDTNKVGGCMLPLCTGLSSTQRSFAKAQIDSTFCRLPKAWDNEYHKAYSHIELDVPNKIHFFRRLSNIAYLKGIKEKETMVLFEQKSVKFKNPSRGML